MLQQIDAFFHEHITGADSQVWITLAILGFIAALGAFILRLPCV